MAVEDASTETDVLVVGAGPAGYTAAIRAGQLGLDVTLVERDAYGGACLNHGCIPSKALISATNVAHDAGHAEEMGIHADPTIDLPTMVAWKDGIVDRLSVGVEKLCKANGVRLVEGTAAFGGEHSVRVERGGDDRRAETIEFEHAIVATGSRPIELPDFSFDDEPVLSSREALALTEVPDSLAIVGAGYIGMELAGVFAKLGTAVTVVEMLDAVLPGYETDLVRPVKRRAESMGVEFQLGRTASTWLENDDGTITVTTEPVVVDDSPSPDGTQALRVEKVLVAVGREPVTDTVGLDAIGIDTDDRGFIEIDDQCRTAVGHVFAVGDVAGDPMLAHKGGAEGAVTAAVIAGESTSIDGRSIPAVVFTDPEIATVGMAEGEAEVAGFESVVGQFPFRASGRAVTTGHDDGFVRIVADRETGRVLGGQIVGSHASELIGELGLAVELGATLEVVAATIHTHPTLSEATMEAAENALGRAIHTLNR